MLTWSLVIIDLKYVLTDQMLLFKVNDKIAIFWELHETSS